MKNFYKVLSLMNFSEIELVKSSYRTLAKKYHPDTSHKNSEDRMVEINQAFEILGDPVSKCEYDKQLKEYLLKKSSGDLRSVEPENLNNKKPLGKRIFDNVNYAINSFVKHQNELARERENAYISGRDMSDWNLVHSYLRNIGPIRKGLGEALLERGLLKKVDEQLVPTEEFQRLRRSK